MAKIKFREIKLSASNKERLEQINSIIEEYQEQDYVLTLRQLYYQLVSRDIIPNKQAEYSKLSILLKEGRMGGIVDWEAIEDRLRQPYTPSSFDSPRQILNAAINQYEKPRMKGQNNYLEVWVEKDALSGVLRRVTSKYHVPLLVNRGYSSCSSMFDSYERFIPYIKKDKKATILYLGDFDPSGIDMIRDIEERICEFVVAYYLKELIDLDDEEKTEEVFIEWFKEHFEITPIALTRQQIRQYNPPSNPAKITDTRAKSFIEKHGATSWEVDALRPEVLNALVTNAIEERIDLDLYNSILSQEEVDIKKLKTLSAKL